MTVVLRNQGDDPFRPEVFGNAIKVRRTLRADGGSHYALMSASGTPRTFPWGLRLQRIGSARTAGRISVLPTLSSRPTPSLTRFALRNRRRCSTGKLIDKTREQLNAILDHFSITIDNPLSVLSQEVAKRFLASAKPADLYKVRWPVGRIGVGGASTGEGSEGSI